MPLAVWDVVLGVVIFGFIAGVLFGVSGVWPPFVAVHSDSMTPQVQKGDLLVVTELGRYMRAVAESARSWNGGGPLTTRPRRVSANSLPISISNCWRLSIQASGAPSTSEVHRSISSAPQSLNDTPDGQPTRAS